MQLGVEILKQYASTQPSTSDFTVTASVKALIEAKHTY
jgi:hypothetical protein